jgi:hypothetical protein
MLTRAAIKESRDFALRPLWLPQKYKKRTEKNLCALYEFNLKLSSP